MAGIEAVASPGTTWPVPRPKPSSAAPMLGSKAERDALILLTALEGDDLQTARRKVAALEESRQDPASRGDAPPEATTGGTPPAPPAVTTAPAVLLRVEAEATVVHLEIRRDDAQVVLDAASVRIGIRRQQAAAPPKDPLVVDLTGGGPRTTGSDGAVSFDLAATGSPAPTSWVGEGTALLALDRNGNGRIDNGGELFGDQHGAPDGYEELRTFDADGNAVIDARDPVYGRLLLLDGNGHTSTLVEAGVASLDLGAARGTVAQASGGDPVLRQATARTADGRTLDTYALGLCTFDVLA